jgi:hypothetical protein
MKAFDCLNVDPQFGRCQNRLKGALVVRLTRQYIRRTYGQNRLCDHYGWFSRNSNL